MGSQAVEQIERQQAGKQNKNISLKTLQEQRNVGTEKIRVQTRDKQVKKHNVTPQQKADLKTKKKTIWQATTEIRKTTIHVSDD